MNKDTCGMLVRSHKGPHLIINADHPYTRRRFSLGHEIGHFFLGHESAVSYLKHQNRRKEVHANKYSAALLMPDELFWHVHKENSSIKEMAHWLRVSTVSVAIRCLELGIRQIEAEFVKSEYFDSVYEVAATLEVPKKKIEEQPKRSSIMTDEGLLNSAWFREKSTYNEKMIDRYRNSYGYE